MATFFNENLLRPVILWSNRNTCAHISDSGFRLNNTRPSTFSSGLFLLHFRIRRTIFLYFPPKTCLICKYTFVFFIIIFSRRVKLITSFTHDYTRSSVFHTHLPFPFLHLSLSLSLSLPSKNSNTYGETTDDGYESTAPAFTRRLARRKLRKNAA